MIILEMNIAAMHANDNPGSTQELKNLRINTPQLIVPTSVYVSYLFSSKCSA